MKNRLLIYFFYDKDGIVDDYVTYFLQAFKPFCKEICVVVNGFLQKESENKLQQNANLVMIRDNIGFDSCAYRHAIEQYGYEELKKYDEVILANFTMFGPIFTPDEMFQKMEQSKCDFWGITKHPATTYTMAGVKVNEHIQSYFISYKKNLLESDDFKKYWQTLQVPTNYEEAVAFHELRGTEYFESKGYKSATYINPDKYRTLLENKPYFHYIGQQIVEDSMPFIKRKIFSIKKNMLEFPIEDSMPLLFTYIEKTNYPISLIIENLKRTMPADQINCFSLTSKYMYLTLKRWIILSKAKKYIKRINTINDTRYLLKLTK